MPSGIFVFKFLSSCDRYTYVDMDYQDMTSGEKKGKQRILLVA
jgi:hypothetical protein